MKKDPATPSTEAPAEETPAVPVKKKTNWFKISVIANILIVTAVATGLGGLALLHQSDTNPMLCRSCHVMEQNVDSYLTSANLDNVHYQAGVQCKQCHDYPIPAEIKSGFLYLTGNYEDPLPKINVENDMCLQCHISYEHVANSTDYLVKNPHRSHNGEMKCSTCHVSHGEQIDYCGQCHDNGGQRLIGEEIIPRVEPVTTTH